MYKRLLDSISRPITLLVLLYVLVGSAWILFSDKIVFTLFSDPAVLTKVQTYKGWFYVLGSGGLMYFLLSLLVKDIKNKERDLRDTEHLQQDFLNKHYQPLWKSDSQGNCIFSNEKWLHYTGEPVPGNVPFAWLEGVHPDDKPSCIDKFTYGFIGKKGFELEYRMLVRQNEYHYVLNTCIPYYSANGQFQGFFGYYSDIQEKKQLEEKYRDSSRRYGYLFANNPSAMLVYDRHDFRILEANKAALELYGYTDKEMLSMSITDLRPASEMPAFMEQVSTELPEFHRSSGWIHKRKDGKLFKAEISAHSLPVNGNRDMRLVLIRDISAHIKAFRSAREGDRRFKAIFEHSPQGALICNDDMKISDINSAACHILDIDRDAALNLSLKDFMNMNFDPAADDYIEKMGHGIPLIGEVYMVRSSGVVFRSSFYSIRFMENGIPKLYFTFNDVDEKHKMQTALQESERINATLVANLPGMVYRCAYDEAWTMTYVSLGVKKLTGYNSSEILYNSEISYEEIIHPEDRHKVRQLMTRWDRKKLKFDLQYRIITKEGKIKWVWELAHALFDAHSNIAYLEGFVMDITREREAQQEVEFQSMFLGLIIDNIPFPLFYKDINGVYNGCNKMFCEFLGREKNEIVGHTVFEIFEHEEAQLFYEKDQILLKEGGSQTYETEIMFPNGRKMDAVFHKSVFYNPQQEPLGIIGIYFDITQRVQAEKVIKKQLEELGRINSELERFSYTVSHDLRSPLVTIKGFLGLLVDDLAEQNQEQVKEDILRIGNATDKMQQLLEDLLKLSRVGKMVEQKETFPMSQVANEARELLYGVLKEKKCEVSVQQDMPDVLAGKARIRELYQNLIENAVKFSSKQQQPFITIYSRKDKDADVFCVEDNGIGIKKEYHEKIFGIFNKLDNSSSGNGLGLSLVKRIVENHYGRIWVESEGDGHGSTFCFTLNSENPED